MERKSAVRNDLKSQAAIKVQQLKPKTKEGEVLER